LEILEILQHKLDKLGITYDELDAQITLQEVDQCILNYCHIDCMPEELLFVRVNMALDYIRYMEGNKPKEDGSLQTNTQVGALTSIKSGEVSYNFSDVSNSKNNVANAHTVDLDNILNNYTYQLNNFRRVVW